MHIHLNLAGRITGDMFIAALLDAFPHLEEPVVAAIDALNQHYPVVCSLAAHREFEVAGRRFEIEPFDRYFGYIPFASPVNSQGDCSAYEPETWESVRANLDAAQLSPGVRSHALQIFELIVKMRAAHGRRLERVIFDEVGAWDSMAQVVGAAVLIESLRLVQWSVSPRPNAQFLTHVGAALVDYLRPPSAAHPLPDLAALTRSGIGFGSERTTVGGYLRVLCFDDGEAALAPCPAATQAPKWVAERV